MATQAACPHTEVVEDDGYVVCQACGLVLDSEDFASHPTFTKDAGGASTVDGHFVSDTGGARGAPRIAGGRVYTDVSLSLQLLLFATPLLCLH